MKLFWAAPLGYGTVLALLVLGTTHGFFNLARWLYVQDPLPRKLDVIFVFDGDTRRLHYARRLWERYPDARLWVSEKRPDYIREYFGQPGSGTLRVFTECYTTVDEVVVVARQIDSLFKDSSCDLGLVSSPLHMRRISMLTGMSRVLRNKGCKVVYIPAPKDLYSWNRKDLQVWWKRDCLYYDVIKEIVRVLVVPLEMVVKIRT